MQSLIGKLVNSCQDFGVRGLDELSPIASEEKGETDLHVMGKMDLMNMEMGSVEVLSYVA